MEKGFDVKIKYKKDSFWGAIESVVHNITEIHYHYRSLSGKNDRIAFESDIHGTGVSIKSDYIEEFEVVPATKIADNF